MIIVPAGCEGLPDQLKLMIVANLVKKECPGR